MIHELHDLLKEQNKVNGEWKDDIDLCVDEIKANEGRHVCPVCQATMERTKRKSVNPDCRVSLKADEKQVQGSDILSTALIAPICCYQQRVKEMQFGFTIDEKEEGHIFLKEKLADCHDEFQHVPSNHPDHPVKVVAGDPIFVNPNSSDALKEVLRRVGKASNVKRYNPDDLQARELLNTTMDGLPYLVCRGVIDVKLGSECGGGGGGGLKRRVLVSIVSKAISGSSVVLCKNLAGLHSALASFI